MRTRKYRRDHDRFNKNTTVIDEYAARFSVWQTSINLLTALAALLICFGLRAPDIVVNFDDKSSWSEDQWSGTNRKKPDTDLLRFLVEKTGLQPQSIHLAEALPQP